MVELSIIICTYNRARHLRDLLESIGREVTPRMDLEVVVVDNRSTDNTKEIVEEFRERISPLIYVFEDNQGLSFARNTGAVTATKEFVLYVDDDAVLSEAFLDRAEIVLRRFNPDLFGGPVVPRFDREPPSWFDADSEIRQFERFSGFSADGSISGGNFGVRRKLFSRLGFFDTALGMKGDSLGLGEDREFVERYRNMVPVAAQRLYYAVELPVLHFTAPSKFEKKYQYARKFHGNVARELAFVLHGKRGLMKSLFLTSVLLGVLPVQSIWILARTGFSERGRYIVVRQFVSLMGRLWGAISAACSAAGLRP